MKFNRKTYASAIERARARYKQTLQSGYCKQCGRAAFDAWNAQWEREAKLLALLRHRAHERFGVWL